mmetsp:Transcript_2185/g.3061  ORF Transcript_2185/g.3061 Transcript_2185/m.3061 type:complete len:89 (-) Transcript_2185:315-581(-)
MGHGNRVRVSWTSTVEKHNESSDYFRSLNATRQVQCGFGSSIIPHDVDDRQPENHNQTGCESELKNKNDCSGSFALLRGVGREKRTHR